MDKQKLVVVIMGQNCEKFLPMCLESVKDADAIVYCSGGIGKEDYIAKSIASEFKGYKDLKIIENEYKQDDPQMNGKQRNFYLNYVKEKYPDWWCLALDADEVVDDLDKIKELINRSPYSIYSVKMRHFHNDLGHEDSTTDKHFVPNRLFKISLADKYSEVEHSVLKGIEPCQYSATDCTTIWHLAHINHCLNIKNRYEKNIKHSNVHNKQFLDWWLRAHIFGQYPNKQIDLRDIPDVILKNFHIDKDEFYFRDRGVEIKHTVMVKQWNDYFKPSTVLDLGCGRGPYLYFWKWYCPSKGIELSKWACDNAFTSDIICGDITDSKNFVQSDLITAIDVLEHLDDTQLDYTLKNMVEFGNKFIFSIPFRGDPNLDNDKTHKQFRTKNEWKELIKSHGIDVEDAPKDWAFSDQLLIGKKI